MRRSRLFATLSLLMLLVTLAVGTYLGKHYTCEARVYAVDGNCVTFEDVRGELWTYESEEHYDLDTHVKIKYDTNGTTNYIYDDTIVGVERR